MQTKIIAFILSFLSFFAFWNPHTQPNCIPETREYVGEVPDQYGVWPTKEFEQGCARPLTAVLMEAYFAVDDVRNGNATESLLLLHKGKLVYERYADGWDEGTPHWMYSVTKSVVSALVGIAISEGKIKGIDQKVIDFYPDAVIAPGQESKRDITIEQLLTHTSGLPGDDDDTDWEWWSGEDSGKAAFETPQAAAPGTRYSYSSGPGCHTLACLVSRAVGMNLFEYAKKKLFGPLGMTSVTWDAAEDGRNFGGFGISMTSRDMLRFGYLYLNHGRWEDNQIIPAQWVEVSPPQSKSAQAYGYLFWNFPLLPFDDSFAALGAYGQQIVVVPAWDMVIVHTGRQSDLSVFMQGIEAKLDEMGLKFW